MTIELELLVYTSLLFVALTLFTLVPLVVTHGLPYALGNRDDAAALPVWGERAVRAQRNLLEYLLPFAVLVLVAHAAGVSNEATERGAMLFFWGRVVHASVYVAGIPYVRTLAFVASLMGMLDILRALVTA